MWNWLRKLFLPPPQEPCRRPYLEGGGGDRASQAGYRPPALSQLYVRPDETEDFDIKACERLLATLQRAGAVTVDDVQSLKLGVHLEDFFEGNRTKHSLAANVNPPPPYDTATAWYELLKHIRLRDDVHDVLVGAPDIEAHEDGRIGSWPYSDTIWIYSSLSRKRIAELVAPLEPDEVIDASVQDPNWDLRPPYLAPSGTTAYWVWWD